MHAAQKHRERKYSQHFEPAFNASAHSQGACACERATRADTSSKKRNKMQQGQHSHARNNTSTHARAHTSTNTSAHAHAHAHSPHARTHTIKTLSHARATSWHACTRKRLQMQYFLYRGPCRPRKYSAPTLPQKARTPVKQKWQRTGKSRGM